MILAGGVGRRLSILTEQRAKPAVPFGAKFRIIDFVLSNCMNSGLSDVGLLTQYRPQSLIDHVGSGQAWDLDRSLGGLQILQPEPHEETGGWYRGTADAITSNIMEILRRPSEDVLILSADHVYNMDYRPLIRLHRERRFPATVAAARVASDQTKHFGMIHASQSGVIESFEEKPDHTTTQLASMGIYIFRRDILLKLLQDDAQDPSSSHDFGQDIFPKLIQFTDVGVFDYSGYWQDIGTIQAFYQDNMKLLNMEHRSALFHRDWSIRTPSMDAPPVRITSSGVLAGSLAAHGASISGECSHSLLFPGVVIESGAKVTDSILMNGVHVERDAVVSHAILDKRVRVGAESSVGRPVEESTGIPANQEAPELLNSGLTVVAKDVTLEPGSRVGGNVSIGGRYRGARAISDGSSVHSSLDPS